MCSFRHQDKAWRLDGPWSQACCVQRSGDPDWVRSRETSDTLWGFQTA